MALGESAVIMSYGECSRGAELSLKIVMAAKYRHNSRASAKRKPALGRSRGAIGSGIARLSRVSAGIQRASPAA